MSDSDMTPDVPPPEYESSSDEEEGKAKFYHSSPGGAITAVPGAPPVMNQVGNYRASPVASGCDSTGGAGAGRRPSSGAGAAAAADSGSGAGAGAGAGSAPAAATRVSRAASSTSDAGIVRKSSASSMPRRESTPEEIRERLICYFGLELPYFHLVKHGRWGSPNVRRFWIDLFIGAQNADPALRYGRFPPCHFPLHHLPCRHSLARTLVSRCDLVRRVRVRRDRDRCAAVGRWDALGRGAKKPRTLMFSNIASIATGRTTKVLRRTGNDHSDHLYLSFMKKNGGSVDLQVRVGRVHCEGRSLSSPVACIGVAAV